MREVSLVGRRRQRTVQPASMSLATTTEPMKPLPPVTKTEGMWETSTGSQTQGLPPLIDPAEVVEEGGPPVHQDHLAAHPVEQAAAQGQDRAGHLLGPDERVAVAQASVKGYEFRGRGADAQDVHADVLAAEAVGQAAAERLQRRGRR